MSGGPRPYIAHVGLVVFVGSVTFADFSGTNLPDLGVTSRTGSLSSSRTYCSMGISYCAVVYSILKYVDIDGFVDGLCTFAPLTPNGARGELAMASLRRPGFPPVGGTSGAVSFSFPAQGTRREAADVTFRLRTGGTSGSPRSLQETPCVVVSLIIQARTGQELERRADTRPSGWP